MNLITMNVHGVARIETETTTPDQDYVAREFRFLDAEGNLLLDVTAFPADRKTVPGIEEVAK